MFTISIGSCFSRRVAARIPGTTIISSVYHNRSDVLFDILQTHGTNQRSRWEIGNFFSVAPEPNDPFSPYSILSNQSLEGLGLHDLPDGLPLLSALGSRNVGLIIIDNFIDLVGRLVETDIGSFYCRHERFKPPAGSNLGPRIAPDNAAKNFEAIISELSRWQPNASIVLLQFPVNNFPSADRQHWGWNFRDALNLPNSVVNIPVRRVRAVDGVPHHFTGYEYARFAQQIIETTEFARALAQQPDRSAARARE